MTYERLYEQLRRRHARKRSRALVAAAVAGVASGISLVWLGPLNGAHGLHIPLEQLSAAQAGSAGPMRVAQAEEPCLCLRGGAGTADVSSRRFGASDAVELRPSMDAARTEEPIACLGSSPAEGQSPEVTVLASASLRPTLP